MKSKSYLPAPTHHIYIKLGSGYVPVHRFRDEGHVELPRSACESSAHAAHSEPAAVRPVGLSGRPRHLLRQPELLVSLVFFFVNILCCLVCEGKNKTIRQLFRTHAGGKTSSRTQPSTFRRLLTTGDLRHSTVLKMFTSIFDKL